MLQNDYPFLIFSKAISRRVVQIPAYNGGVLNRHRPTAAGYLNSGFTYQLVFKVAYAQWLLFHQWIWFILQLKE